MKETITDHIPVPEAEVETLQNFDTDVAEGTPIDSNGKLAVELMQKLTKLEEQFVLEEDKYKRLYAEFDNFRKRTVQERLSLIETAGEKVLQQVLPILDDFERAIVALPQPQASLETFVVGVTAIHSKLLHILEQASVKVMQIEKGNDFDPEFQEAITQIPVTEVSLKGKVVEVVEKGYLLKSKVLRHAKVIIGQ